MGLFTSCVRHALLQHMTHRRSVSQEPLRVRYARRRDLRQCYRLARMRPFRTPGGHAPATAWMREFIRTNQPFLVAMSRGRILGFIVGEIATGGVAICHLLGVDRRWRRQGIGSALLLAFEGACQGRGATHILLYAYEVSSATAGFFRKHRYKRGSHVVEMSRRHRSAMMRPLLAA